MESAIVPGIYDPTLADEDLRIDTERAYRMVRRLAREEGLLAGISSGAAVAAMLDVAARTRTRRHRHGVSRRRGKIPQRNILDAR